MLLQKKSLSLKLLLVVGGLLILMSLSFILVSSISLNDAEKDIVSEVSTEVLSKQLPPSRVPLLLISLVFSMKTTSTLTS